MTVRWFEALCLSVLSSFSCAGQTLQVQPAQVMTDQTAEIHAIGLAPRAPEVIRAELVDGEGHPWSSEAELVADDSGAVDLAIQAPVKGSYRSAFAMGLLWSMTPAEKGATMYRPPAEFAPQSITLHLLQGGKEAASAQLQ